MTTELPPSDSPCRIRSFVRRQGRITPAQERALTELWPRYGLDAAEAFDSPKVFGRRAPVILEIGFGNGESLAAMAAAAPDEDFVGVEVHRPGVGHLLLTLQARGLDNVRVVCADAVGFLEQAVPDGSLDGVQIFFPDPWHKKRHHKRRLINPAFVALIARKLTPGGLLHCATDWENYAQHMLEALEAHPNLRNLAGKGAYCEHPRHRPLTKFEARGARLGHGVWDLLFVREDAVPHRAT
jgi:tRNA (guanine-N7-)-methyltransferase